MINDVDIAVHSMKMFHFTKELFKLLFRKSQYIDILVHKGNFLNESGTIATGSLRRQAQWLNKYPTHKVVDLREM
jgi:hydroxymethylbilane synthase